MRNSKSMVATRDMSTHALHLYDATNPNTAMRIESTTFSKNTISVNMLELYLLFKFKYKGFPAFGALCLSALRQALVVKHVPTLEHVHCFCIYGVQTNTTGRFFLSLCNQFSHYILFVAAFHPRGRQTLHDLLHKILKGHFHVWRIANF